MARHTTLRKLAHAAFTPRQVKRIEDGIVTVVDAKHVQLHIDDTNEVREQIAFADVILLNKADLVSATELDVLEQRLHSMNAWHVSTARSTPISP